MTNILYSRQVKIGFFVIVLIAVLSLISANFLPRGIDWYETYRPAGLAVLHGKSPFSVEGYFAAPWAILPILPFAWLPENVGRAAFLVVSLLAFGFVAYRLGASPISLGAFLISPPVLHCLLNASIDWVALLGFILPPQIGLFFLAIKPQIGIGVAAYWFFETLRKSGWRETVRVFLPATLTLLASLVIFGLWPLRFKSVLGEWWNASLWPASIPIGMVLLVAAIKRSNIRLSMAASPCFSPYVLFYSWSGALVALAKEQAEMVAAVAGLWILVILRSISGG